MKLFLSIALLALTGCGSKPSCNITPTNSPAYVRGVDRFGKKHIPPTSVLLPNSIAGVGDEKTYTRFEYDEARHVTPAQWEAAQGLYNPHRYFMKLGGSWVEEYCGPETQPCAPTEEIVQPVDDSASTRMTIRMGRSYGSLDVSCDPHSHFVWKNNMALGCEKDAK